MSHAEHQSPFDLIDDAIRAIADGKMIIVTDIDRILAQDESALLRTM